MTVPSIGAVIRVMRADRAGLLEFRDFGIGVTQDAQADASGFERCFGRAHVALGGGKLSLGLLHILERGGLAFIEITGALLDNLRQVELGARLVSCALSRDELVLWRHLLGAVDLQQRVAALDLITDLGDQAGDPAGERRHDGRAGVFIECDLADRRSLIEERIGFDLHHLELVHLVGNDPNEIGALRRTFGRSARYMQCSEEEHRPQAMQ